MPAQKDIIKTQWDLAQLYQSPHDPLIERDMLAIEKTVKAFQKKWQGKIVTASPAILAKALADFEKLYEVKSFHPSKFQK